MCVLSHSIVGSKMAISRQVTLQREEEGALFSLTGVCPSQLLTQVTVDVQSCTLRMYVCVWLSFGRIRSKNVTVDSYCVDQVCSLPSCTTGGRTFLSWLRGSL